jgi:hypothetical protein
LCVLEKNKCLKLKEVFRGTNVNISTKDFVRKQFRQKRLLTNNEQSCKADGFHLGELDFSDLAKLKFSKIQQTI